MLRSIGAVAVGLVIADLLAYNTMVVFVTQKPRSPMRSAVYALLAAMELILAFAVLHLTLRSQYTPMLDPVSAVYFSAVTLATLGYGDIQPSPGATGAQLLVILQILAGLYFFAVILTSIVTWASAAPRFSTLAEIREESKKLDQNDNPEEPPAGA